jgi:hemerythrin-like domain-containing protein
MNALVDELRDDHDRFRRYISAFERETTLLANGELSDYSLIELLAEFFCAMPDETHHRIEDTIYLQLAERLTEDLANESDSLHAIFDLRADHQEMAAFAETFRDGVAQMLSGAELPRTDLAALSVEYIQNFRTHMLNEEIHFFPLISEFLTVDDWKKIDEIVAESSESERLKQKDAEIHEIEENLKELMRPAGGGN